MMRRALSLAAVALVALATTTVGLSACAGPDTEQQRGATVVAAPDGSGSECTQHKPCTIDEALAGLRDGGTIGLTDGDFGDLALDSGGAAGMALTSGGGTVVIRAVDGAAPRFGKLDLDLPTTTWQGVTITGGVYLDAGADGTVLDGIHVDGAGVFVHADDVVIRDSIIENGTSVDGIQVAGARSLLIEDSIVRGFGQGPGSDVHSDCVQVFDSSDIVLRGNYLGNCDNASLIFSPGSGTGVSKVVVEDNFIQGCVEESERCSRGTALDLREATVSDVTVSHNTLLDGSVTVANLPGLVFDRNIVEYASNCDMPMTNTIVAKWNTGQCEQPTALGRDGNRQGEVEVRDRAGGDLRLVDPDQAQTDGGRAGAGG